MDERDAAVAVLQDPVTVLIVLVITCVMIWAFSPHSRPTNEVLADLLRGGVSTFTGMAGAAWWWRFGPTRRE